MQWNPNKHEPLEYLLQRIAIDFDSLDYWDIYAVVDKLQVDGYSPKVWRTRHGYHIVCKLSGKKGFWSLLKLRSQYGDDRKRISSDIMRITQGWPVDCLFDSKGNDTKYRRQPHLY